MIKSNFNTEYHAPKCKVVALITGAMYLETTSQNYGDANRAGKTLNEDDEYTYDL